MAKVAKTGDRAKAIDTSKSTDCPKCGKPYADREAGKRP